MVETMLHILSDEMGIYKKLLELSMSKKNAMMSNDIEVLNSITKSEGLLIADIAKLERDRTKVLETIAEQTNADPNEIGIEAVYRLANDEQSGRLDVIRAEMEEIITKQMEYNDINKLLIEANLEYINSVLSLVTSEGGNKVTTYGVTGRSKAVQGSNLSIIDTKI